MIKEKCYLYGSCKCQTAGCVVLPDDGCPVYRYFKELIIKDYKNHLKADMVAMLEELKEEFKELKSYESADGQDLVMLADIGILFQQKIDSLKEVNDGTN